MTWQPIESAPKDGSVMLLYCADRVDRFYSAIGIADHYCIGYWGEEQGGHGFGKERLGWFAAEAKEEIWGYGSEMTGPMTHTENIEVSPTHWMPLPEPPQ